MLIGSGSGVGPIPDGVVARFLNPCYKMTAAKLLRRNRMLYRIYHLNYRWLPLCYKISVYRKTPFL